jgi:hypothetical protein
MVIPDRARSGISIASAAAEVPVPSPAARHGVFGPGAVQTAKVERKVVVGVPDGGRRRSRGAVARHRVVQLSLSEEEFGEVSAAASRLGMARGAYAAEAVLAAARGEPAPALSPLREALTEVMTAAGLVRRAGTNLNQAVARLNATGQPGPDLVPAAEFCARVIRRLDDTAEQLRRTVP